MPVRFPRVRPHRCRLYNSADLNTTTGAWLTLTWDTEDYDTDDMHSTATNTSRITARHAGTYLIVGLARFAANVTGERILNILKNGATVKKARFQIPASQITETYLLVTEIDNLNVDDYLELRVYQNSGGDLLTHYALNSFSAIRIA